VTEQEFYVEIVSYPNEESEEESVVERRGPFSERKADRVDDGLNINLNHEAYYTRIVESPLSG
jgi:hypothetical protein